MLEFTDTYGMVVEFGGDGVERLDDLLPVDGGTSLVVFQSPYGMDVDSGSTIFNNVEINQSDKKYRSHRRI